MRAGEHQNHSRMLAAVAFAIFLSVPLLLGGDGPDRAELDSRRKRIEDMSSVERERLKQKHETFRRLNAEQRDSLRRLHRELDADRQAGGRLHSILRNYHTWLRTLSPWQRAEIRAQTDTSRQLRLIRNLIDEQTHEPDLRRPPDDQRESPPDVSEHRPDRPGSSRPKLPVEDLDKIMTILMKTLSLSKSQQRELHALDPTHRRLRVMLLLVKKYHNAPTSQPGRWIDDETTRKIIKQISNKQRRNRLEQSKNRPEMRRLMLLRLIATGLFHSIQPELERRKPTEQQMRRFLRMLEKKTRRELMSHNDPRIQRERLRTLYVQKHGDPLMRDVLALQKHLRRFLPRHRRRRRDARPPRGKSGFRLDRSRRKPGDRQPPRRNHKQRRFGKPRD